MTFWAFLAQTLAPETSCRDIVRKVQTWWLQRYPGTCIGSASTCAYTTTQLDPIAYPIAALGGLYFQRWSVELHFREIKITLGMDVLRCQSPDMVEKEVRMHAISYNLVRALMQQAAIDHQVDLASV